MTVRMYGFWSALLIHCAMYCACANTDPDVSTREHLNVIGSQVDSSAATVKLEILPIDSGAVNIRRTSLSEVLAVAREHANIVLEAAAKLDTAMGRVQAAHGDLLPGVSLSTGINYLDGQQVGSFGDTKNVAFATFEPAASVFYRVNPGAAIARSTEVHHEAKAAEFDLREAERTAMLQAGVAYFDLALACASYQISKDLVADAERFLNITKARAEAEIGAGAEISRAETELARSRQVAIKARGGWEQASIRLATLLRWGSAEIIVPIDNEIQSLSLIEPQPQEHLFEEAESARPDLGAAQARSQAAENHVTAAWWDSYGPEIDAGLGGRFIGTRINDLNDTTIAHLLIRLSFDFGDVGRANVARSEAVVANIKTQKLLDELRGGIEEAQSKVKTTNAAIPEARIGVQAAERSYRTQLARFEAGTGLGLEVIESQNSLARAKLALTEVIVRFNLAQIELAADIGRLTPDLIDTTEGSLRSNQK